MNKITEEVQVQKTRKCNVHPGATPGDVTDFINKHPDYEIISITPGVASKYYYIFYYEH